MLASTLLVFALASTGVSSTPLDLRATTLSGLLSPLAALKIFGRVSDTLNSRGPPAELYSPLVAQKVLRTAQAFNGQYPQWTDTNTGVWQLFNRDGWTTGFFPSTLYAMYDRTKICPRSGDASQWLNLARQWSTAMLPLTNGNGQGHDQGFLSFPFVDELSINPNNQTAKNAINKFANLLAARFNPIVGCTRSWDSSDPTDFQVIIDNLMNLELLFISADLTGNNTLREIAKTHADTTIKNQIRADGGSWHVVEYNSTTGVVIKKRTAQGYADWSTWSRGQSWAIFGFANMYRRTRQYSYLQTARRVADYFITHVPADGVVPWDFNAPVAGRPADSSASMIAAYGLLMLADQELSVGNPGGSQYYTGAAVKLVRDNTALAWRPSWQSLLSNGTVNKPANNALTGTVYGDYYFILTGSEFVRRGLAFC